VVTNPFTISLPQSTSVEQRAEIETALRTDSDIDSTGRFEPRGGGIDPASILLWVQIAGGIVTAAGGAAVLVERVVRLLRGKGIKGATITLADGAVLQVDSATASDIERLLKGAARKPRKKR
jgi:hypothetical protein